MKIVEVKDLVYSYNGTDNAVDGISFTVEKGSYTTIIGHNGSGKSTLAKLIAGLLPLKSGEIYLDGIKLEEKTLPELRYKLGIVFQNPDNQFIGSTVRDDIAFGLENHQIPSEQMEELITRYAASVNMSGFLDSEPNRLSGGQKQRVAIAGILAIGPQIIIFDEASSMLDPQGKEEIKKVITDLHHNAELTIISITHDIEEALNSDQIIVLNRGKVYAEGKPEKIFADEKALKKIALDIPFTYKVALECAKQGIKIDKKRTTAELAEELWQSVVRN